MSVVQGQDTATVHTPLPRGVGTVVRVVLNAPSWLQITVIVAGVITFAWLAFWIFKRRRRVIGWLGARSRGWKLAFVGLVLVAVTGFASFGVATWNYTQHNNDFCIGCHVMSTAWTKFQHSEHKKLKCHDCHQQSIFASMRQLYFWVAERPKSIPVHAKVPTSICQNCHNQANPDSSWKHIIASAGHSVHLRNDKPALRNVQCVTCHGAEVHHFVPIQQTCGQSDCHANLRVQLGKMAGQSSMHCTGCHAFTDRVADNISPDSARVSLVPTGEKCLACHPMERRVAAKLAEFSPTREAHKAVCGACHDPHKQLTPKAAFQTCATAECHARADTLTPFHRGLPKGALANCGSCHKAHVWKVQSKECQACHRTPPDRRIAHDIALEMDSGDEAIPTPSDTILFSHARHKTVGCSSCHSSEESHGAVVVRPLVGCQQCHHGPKQKAECSTCHTQDKLVGRPQQVSLTMSVWPAARTRSLGFEHGRHAKVECKTCHTKALTLGVEKTCQSCHAEHHTATASCVSCHPPVPTRENTAHPRAVTHTGCSGSGCHTDASVLALAPTRNVCLSCHREQLNHQPTGDCAACHLVNWSPAVRRSATEQKAAP
jgi:nitrate/TMAO reductase-like tetraheme cytochrome c subunit